MTVWLALPGVAAGVVALVSFAAPTGAEEARTQAPPPTAADDETLGRSLYLTQCGSCHGTDGRGVTGRGPTLEDEGEAAVDYVLRTGRMPIAQPNVQPKRGPVRYSEEEIVALVGYVGSLGDGPDIPEVDAANGDLAAGGELYRLNCAACHVASLSGAAIGGGRQAPSLMDSTATQIGEAVVVGPGAMPVFTTFTAQDRDNLAAYILDLQQRNRETAGRNFGGAGPVAEGLAAWLLGLIPLIALSRWIGAPHEGRDTGALPALERTPDPERAPPGVES